MSARQQFVDMPDQHKLTYKDFLLFSQPDCKECQDHVYHWRWRALPPLIAYGQLVANIIVVIMLIALIGYYKDILSQYLNLFWVIVILGGLFVIIRFGLRIFMWSIEDPLQRYLHRKMMDQLPPLVKIVRLIRVQCMNHQSVAFGGFGRITRLQKKLDELQEFYEYVCKRPHAYQHDVDLSNLVSDAKHDIPHMQQMMQKSCEEAKQMHKTALQRLMELEKQAETIKAKFPNFTELHDTENIGAYCSRVSESVKSEDAMRVIREALDIFDKTEKWTQALHKITQKDPSWKYLSRLYRVEHMESWLIKLSDVIEKLPSPPSIKLRKN